MTKYRIRVKEDLVRNKVLYTIQRKVFGVWCHVEDSGSSNYVETRKRLLTLVAAGKNLKVRYIYEDDQQPKSPKSVLVDKLWVYETEPRERMRQLYNEFVLTQPNGTLVPEDYLHHMLVCAWGEYLRVRPWYDK